ncbi:transcription termination/antitermination protein NusA [Marinicauda salina]|uniref:Transcription termination/antitermination protein NusA n=1 Tax=Marinicauda salina TaxID=2135793 RepID=A0A2U2BWF5_9PROT|nr:transcription termination factor NusA [Marinicauda salina]PWE18320.1 transcription termination/antitermination protein NusA [Marinicauda salina]
MAIGVSANKLELLQIAKAVAQEKLIDEAIVLEAIEEAIQKAARSRYGAELDIKCDIDPQTGEMRLTRRTTVVEEVENDSQEMSLDEAKKIDKNAEIGTVFEEELPPIEFGRVASQTAKQVITQKVREAERERQFEEYKDRVGEVVNGIVKRVEYGNVIVDLGKAEAVIRRNDGIPRENFQNGDRVRAYIYDVRPEVRGPQIFLSRAHPDFMAALFAQEVPEVYEGIIEIPRVARDPGSRAKIAVISNDSSIDPVGACVGMRGSRVQAVVNELAGEKIDIIPWSPDPATFIVNALQPAEVTKVVLDEEAERIEVVVPDDQLSLAIGRRGQNVRLASQLTGWSIDILTEEEESERRQKEFAERTQLFMDALDVDEVIAQLLATEGFSDIEEIAFVELDEIAVIEGFDDDTAQEIQTRAKEFLEKRAAEQDAKRKELGVEDAVLEVEGVELPMAVKFGENDVKTVEDLAGLVPDDLRGWYETRDGERVREPGILDEFNMSPEDAEALIMRARVAAGWISEEDLEPEAEEADLEEASEEGGEEAAGEAAAEAEPDVSDLDIEDLEAEAERLGVDLGALLDDEDEDSASAETASEDAGEEDDEAR